MQDLIEITRVNRNFLEKIIENHTLEELNKVPEGFKNNIIWNIAHIIVTQQLLTYKLSGVPMNVSDKMVAMYKKGTKTERPVTEKEATEIKKLLFSTLDQTASDLTDGIFTNFQEYPTSTGYVIRSLENAFRFNNFHEGIHLGYILALRKHL